MVPPGQKFGPYEVVSPLGAGGMGEVYRARDPRLGREVALKVIHSAASSDPGRVERFEREARAVAALSHPNVLTVFDVGHEDGQPYLVFELLEGETLRERLERGPLPLRRAMELAIDVCRGLEAAHARELVHRDLKPDNLFISRDGRAKILDFGLAKLRAGESGEGLVGSPIGPAGTGGDPVAAVEDTLGTQTADGVVIGTLGYLSPEQASGQAADARSDLFSLGAILYEMLTGQRAFKGKTPAETLSAILRKDPPAMMGASGPVPRAAERVVRRCLAKEPSERFHSAHDLALALETLLDHPGTGAAAADEVEDSGPYPGLASFEERDARFFFGREGEAEALWQRLRTQRLLAVIGPSGAGKTSFIRAGVVASRPAGWGAVVTTPGTSPLLMLGQALAPSLASDPEALRQLVRFEDPAVAYEVLARWRAAHEQALLVVDQFEELFTLCRPEVQGDFASLLGRLADEGGVHVLLSLRDDFLIRCHDQKALAPVFDHLTPLVPLSGEDLLRALEEPARQRGYAFEDDSLAREMIEEAEGARAPLPLLAFAVAQLWASRDPDRKLLTRAAHDEIGGVAGALARHAERTLERIGAERTPVVRELFRNLVTAQGTRAVAEREDLLSVFPEPEAAAPVLDELISARLLTSYEIEHDDEDPGRQRVEITHESLLQSWPRLVRWQAQDAEGALLRDQLRQASRLWEEKGRPEDLLWSGTPLLEYRAWRARYPGGLSVVEEDFAGAMTARATRARRIRRAVGAGVLVTVSLVAVALALLWRGSEEARNQSEEARAQAEAASLLSLGRMRLAENPTAALAYAIASLERADNEPARKFATEALWAGPIARVIVDDAKPCNPTWSNDGKWLAVGGTAGFLLVDRETGSIRRQGDTRSFPLRFSADGSRLLVGANGLELFTVPGLDLEDRVTQEGVYNATLGPQGILTAAREPDGLHTFRVYPTGGGPARRLMVPPGRLEEAGEGITSFYEDGLLRRWRLDASEAPPLVVGRHAGENVWFSLGPWSPRAATVDPTGEVRVWNLEKGGLEQTLRSQPGARMVALDATGRHLVTVPDGSLPQGTLLGFDRAAPRGAAPFVLRYDEASVFNRMQFHPEGSWFASGHFPLGTLLWNFESRRPVVFPDPGEQPALAFAPEGQLVSTTETTVKLWPLWREPESEPRELWSLSKRGREGLGIHAPQVSRDGRLAVVVDRAHNEIVVLSLDGAKPVVHEVERELKGELGAPSFAPDGRRVAVSTGEWNEPETVVIGILDLESGDVEILRPLDDSTPPCVTNSPGVGPLQEPLWLSDGRLVSEGTLGLRLWDLEAGTSRQLRGCRDMRTRVVLAASDTGVVLGLFDPAQAPGESSTLMAYDMSTGVSREITSHGRRLRAAGLSADGSVLVTGDADGLVRVGRLDGLGPAHLLYGHSHAVTGVAISPDGQRIASASEDDTIRLWAVPDLSEPPLHSWPREALLAKLRSFTNLRAVEAPDSSTGYTVEAGPFPGWAKVPTW